MCNGRKLQDIIISLKVPNNVFSGIDIRKLIAIAQYKKLIKRLHEFPILWKGINNNINNPIDLSNKLINSLEDGHECLDSICCRENINKKNILDIDGVSIIYK
jgi:hypothetical protein